MPPFVDPEKRFWKFVEFIPYHSCWEWTGNIDPTGYGSFTLNRDGIRKRGAHRVSFFFAHGYWPKNQIDHLCRNPTCVRPSHLQDVPARENTTRGLISELNSNKVSKFVGVTKPSHDRPGWWASITFRGRLIHLGTFHDELMAASAYKGALTLIQKSGLEDH